MALPVLLVLEESEEDLESEAADLEVSLEMMSAEESLEVSLETLLDHFLKTKLFVLF